MSVMLVVITMERTSIVRINRIVVACASLGFVAAALGIWVAPEEAARLLGFETVQPGGTAAVRADIGGLFAGLAALCGMAAWTERRSWSLGGAAVVGGIAFGRLLDWLGNRALGHDVPALLVELLLLASLLGLARDASKTTGSSAWAVKLAGLLMVVVMSGAVALTSGDLQMRLFAAGAERRAGTINTAPLEDDALRVAICGSSAPLPSANRAKACAAVFAGGKFYVVDAGPESVENLVLWGIPLARIGGVLLTHFHSDHIGDLGELQLQTWAGGRPGQLPVYGGPGVEQVVNGFNQAYDLDQGYRTEHHGEHVMPSATWGMAARKVTLDGPATEAKNRSGLVFDDGALRVTAIEVDHAPIAPAYAYRFDYKGRSVLITGDFKYHAPLIKAAMDVDVLVSEAIAPQMTRAIGGGAGAAGRTGTAAVMHDIEDYHVTPEEAAAIANAARAQLLVLYHLLPAPDGALARRVFAQGVNAVRPGGWTIADDGSIYELPLGSKAVRVGRMSE